MENMRQVENLHNLEEKFYKACDQIIVIDRKLQDMTIRYEEANKTGHRSLRYNRRLQLVTLEGVRAAFYQYAEKAAEEMTRLRCQLYGQQILLENSDSDSDY